MKNIISLSIICLLSLQAQAKEAKPNKAEPVVAIQTMQDRSATSHADNCNFYGFWSTPGDAIRELLTDELSKVGGISLVEREHISEIYQNEFQLENLDDTTIVEKKKFVAANLAVAGTISEFEWCVSGQDQGLDVGGLLGIGELSVQHKSSKAHVAIDLRLIEVKTGKILKTFHSNGQVDESGISFNASAYGVRMNKDAFNKTPLGEATRIAVKDAASQISSTVKTL